MKLTKSQLTLFVTGIIGAIGGLGCFIASLFLSTNTTGEINFPVIPSKTADAEIVYSDLTGLEISKELKNAPTFCIQTPNGMDGARPQAGLDQAGVVFEAIAEAGITRFAAIYQNPSSAVIGPIRSLRMYYLQWDTPFDCTIVHAGGADDAIAALKSGKYRELDENYTYMYRGTAGGRLWNNLFTTANYLAQVGSNQKSEIKGFARMTPEEAAKDRVDNLVSDELVITESSDSDTSEVIPTASEIELHFSGVASYDVAYNYNPKTNSYDRGYTNGTKHEIYVCPETNLGEVNPEDKCKLQQLSPAVVVAMIVKEKRASDNYHEDITTTGSGNVYIFQNGYVIKGTWKKDSAADQIKFYDKNNEEIKLAPGQTFIEAIPNYGSVDY